MEISISPLNWRFSSDFVGCSKQQTRNTLKTLASAKAALYTCSITRAFGKNSGSSFLFSPTGRKETSSIKNQLEEISQKLEEIRTEALNPLKILANIIKLVIL